MLVGVSFVYFWLLARFVFLSGLWLWFFFFVEWVYLG